MVGDNLFKGILKYAESFLIVKLAYSELFMQRYIYVKTS